MNYMKTRPSLRPTALLLDDDEVMRLFLKSYLEVDFDIRIFGEAAAALDWLKQGNHVDVMLVDLNMPTISGFQFLKAVQQIEHVRSAPKLVLSGSEQSADRVATLQSGAVDFISKPFNPEELKARLELRIRDGKPRSQQPMPLVHNPVPWA